MCDCNKNKKTASNKLQEMKRMAIKKAMQKESFGNPIPWDQLDIVVTGSYKPYTHERKRRANYSFRGFYGNKFQVVLDKIGTEAIPFGNVNITTTSESGRDRGIPMAKATIKAPHIDVSIVITHEPQRIRDNIYLGGWQLIEEALKKKLQSYLF